MKAICLTPDEEKKQDARTRHEPYALPRTISHDPATVEAEVRGRRGDGHCHYDCPLCGEEALPERCPGFRLDWLC